MFSRVNFTASIRYHASPHDTDARLQSKRGSPGLQKETIVSIRIWLITGPLDAETQGHAPVRRWLARGRVRRVNSTESTARRVMNALGHADVETDLGAIRYLAHDDAPPSDFIAAADPVSLEPRLDHLCVHRVTPPPSELQPMAPPALDHVVQEDPLERGLVLALCPREGR